MALRTLVIHNFWWKLLSVLLAYLTWITIDASLRKDRDQTPVITSSHREFLDIPVTILTSPYNTNQFRVNPVAVFVDLSGSADALKKLQGSQITAFVDASSVQDEKQIRRQIRVQVPPDFRVEKVEPDHADVERLTPARVTVPPASISSNQP